MRRLLWAVGALVLALVLAAGAKPGRAGLPATAGAALAVAAAQQDPRYCGAPKREADGSIFRSRAALREFRRLYPCPETGKSLGVCPGWEIDHVVPLACGGCDTVGNLQWLPRELKSAAGDKPKDRWERRVYCQRR